MKSIEFYDPNICPKTFWPKKNWRSVYKALKLLDFRNVSVQLVRLFPFY